MSFDRRWLDDQGSEDCQGRALWALGAAVGGSPVRDFQMMAGQLFALALPAFKKFTSPRAWAFGLIGIHEYLRRLSGDSLVNHTREMLASRLVELFERNAKPDWCWFEDELSYGNAKLAHALILSGRATGQPAVFERGLRALRWLTELQVSEKGHFRPIGSNGYYRRGGVRANFDQQPIEAQATVSACLEAYRATSDFWWYEQPLTGLLAGTISARNSITQRAAVVVMDCTWIESMGTRGRNPRWPSCCRSRRCVWPRTW